MKYSSGREKPSVSCGEKGQHALRAPPWSLLSQRGQTSPPFPTGTQHVQSLRNSWGGQRTEGSRPAARGCSGCSAASVATAATGRESSQRCLRGSSPPAPHFPVLPSTSQHSPGSRGAGTRPWCTRSLSRAVSVLGGPVFLQSHWNPMSLVPKPPLKTMKVATVVTRTC